MENENASTAPTVTQTKTEAREERSKPRNKRPNYNQIHKDKLPLDIHPLPAFIPHNPLSLLRIAYALISEFFSTPTSLATIYHGYFDVATRSVHVTDEVFVRCLWERGFFGKGSLSRSEPTWLHSEKTRLGLIEVTTSDQVTRTRRKEREQMKKERARLERDAIEQQRLKEAGGIDYQQNENRDPTSSNASETLDLVEQPLDNGSKLIDTFAQDGSNNSVSKEADSNNPQPRVRSKSVSWDPEIPSSNGSLHPESRQQAEHQIHVANQEHLQLSLEEAFFLTYGLGVLSIQFPPEIRLQPANNFGLLQLCRQYSYFPPSSILDLQPDDPFLLHYVTYHHFRSLGWVVRDGIKFAVDWLLYKRGPVFDHAEFGVIIIPSYTNPYWFEDELRKQKVVKKRKEKSWSWLHATNRVLTQVTKTLVLCYVDVPSPSAVKACEEKEDIGALLKLYRVREFCVRRWSANRNR